MYYYLKASYGKNYENTILSGILYDSQGKVVEDIFDDGVSLATTLSQESFTIIVNEKNSSIGVWPDMLSGFYQRAGNIFIVSNRAKELFIKRGLINLEFYNLKIKLKANSIENYSIVNVVGKIDCIDVERSIIEYYDDGDVHYVKKLVFDNNKILDNKELFLLGKHKSAEIFVHEYLKDQIQENLTGFDFIHIDDYKAT